MDVSGIDAAKHLTAVLPEGLVDEEAALLGVASVAMRDVRLCGVTVGDRVLVVGAGLIGQFAAQAVRALGGHVTLASRSTTRLNLAAACGADKVVEVPDVESWSALQGSSFDVCVETSGADILDLIFGAAAWKPGVLRYGGKLFLSGGRETVRYSGLAAQSQAIHVMQATHFTRSDLLEKVRLMQRGAILASPLITHRVPVQQMAGIYQALRDDPGTLLGVILDWQDS